MKLIDLFISMTESPAPVGPQGKLTILEQDGYYILQMTAVMPIPPPVVD